MPDLMDKMYCSEQIHIPPTFPYIMKLYCKAAIRTQPYDLLKWSAAYFRALANGEEPPAKERVEFPPYDSPSGITPGYIKVLINQFGKDPETVIPAQVLFKKWTDICLEEYLLVKLIALLGATTQINWVKFVGVCAGFISKTLTHTMILLCELFTDEPEGGMATVPYSLFVDLYMYLAQMECGPLTEKDLAEQEEADQSKEICEVVEKIREGLYEEGEELGEAEDNLTLGKEEEAVEKYRRTTAAEEEPEVEEEEEKLRDTIHDTRLSSRSKRKRGTSVKEGFSQKISEEQAGEEQELENISATSLSAVSSVGMSQSSLSVLSDDKEEKEEKKKSKETEGEVEKEGDGKSATDDKSDDERRRTTFAGVSESTDNERDADESTERRRKTTESNRTAARGTVDTTSTRGKSFRDSSAPPLSTFEKSSERSAPQERDTRGTRGTLQGRDTIPKEEEGTVRKNTIERQSIYKKYTSEGGGIHGSKKSGKIDLDQFQEAIRAKIEAKLAEEDEIMDEEEKELKDLTTYLATASARPTQKFTIDNLGYKIFKKFLRQDVPGIGPYIETSQVEKVVDYMDYWSNKQNGMVMPRNIRHWMCPPLGKLPAQEP